MEDILDRSESYLRIFTQNFVIDRSLPKWSMIIKETGLDKDKNDDENPKDPNSISVRDFKKLDAKDYNLYLGRKMAERIRNEKSIMTTFSEVDGVRDNVLAQGGDEKTSKFSIITKYIKRFINQYNKIEELEVEKVDVIKFFSAVKLAAKSSKTEYIDRVEPYIAALKQAQDMGQQALYDKLEEAIFLNKYESLLYASGYKFKITEAQLVDFVKKTEKGVRLQYVANFINLIPEEVINKKLEADQLLIFDNYCILHYDPDLKSFKMTKQEQEEQRRKKADPILFGMINGSRNLYYITDWIDEYCDLTLEEFLKVSGLDKKDISLDEKIKLGK